MSKEEHSKEPKPKKVKKINNKSKHKDYHDKSHIPYSLNLITPIIKIYYYLNLYLLLHKLIIH